MRQVRKRISEYIMVCSGDSIPVDNTTRFFSDVSYGTVSPFILSAQPKSAHKLFYEEVSQPSREVFLFT